MLGIDTYSLKSLRWNVFQLLDYAHSQNLKAIQASAVNFESLDDAYLTKVKAHADSLNIHLEPGFNCISTLAKSWNPKEETPAKYLAKAIRATKTLKARAFRVFIASPADRAAGTTPEAFIDEVVKSLKQVRTQAEDAQVKVAIENHGEFHSRHIKTIVEQAGPSYTAVCLRCRQPRPHRRRSPRRPRKPRPLHRLRPHPRQLFRFSWKWRRRSPSKVMERTREETKKALHGRREGRHSQAAFTGEGGDLEAL